MTNQQSETLKNVHNSQFCKYVYSQCQVNHYSTDILNGLYINYAGKQAKDAGGVGVFMMFIFMTHTITL